jgi:hypothetical protein
MNESGTVNVNEERAKPHVPLWDRLQRGSSAGIEAIIDDVMRDTVLTVHEVEALRAVKDLMDAVRTHLAKDADTLARTGSVNVTFTAERDGKIRMTSRSFDEVETAIRDQWIEVRWVDGQLIVAKCG